MPPRKVDPLRQVVATSACTGDPLRLAKLSRGILIIGNYSLYFKFVSGLLTKNYKAFIKIKINTVLPPSLYS